MPEIVIRLNAAGAAAGGVAGGKGASLSRMIAGGLPVPDGFVVTTHAFQEFLESCDGPSLIDRLTRNLDVNDSRAVEQASETIRQSIVSRPLSASVAAEIRAAHGDLTHHETVAVRSSAVSEDGANASFAGQQETYLNVRGADDVLGRVRECWASFFSPRALFYRAQKGVLGDTRMAVVVQEMVQADKSGVMFTVDPVNNQRECMVIEGAPGLGEAVVSGGITPDHYVVTRSGGVIVDMFLADAERGRVLSDENLGALWELGLKVERLFGFPQDVEWCIRGGDLLLLQSRPITTLGAHA